MCVLIRGRPSPDFYDEGVFVNTRPRVDFTGPGVAVTDDPTNDGVLVAISGSGGDHGALTDLLADDHTQYARLLGRAGGQTLKGGTAAAEELALRGTDHATPGAISIPDWLRFANLSSDPTVVAGQVAAYAKNGLFATRIVSGVVPFNVYPGEKKAVIFATGQTGHFDPRGDATAGMDGRGMLSNLTETAPGGAVRTLDTNGLYIEYPSLAVLLSVAGIETAAAIVTWGSTLLGQERFRLSHTTQIRAFIGWSNQTLATMVAADQPIGQYMGLQYSTPRGDTNWRHVRKTAGGTFSNSDSGIPISTNWLHHRLLASGAILQTLLDASLVQLHAQVITNAPASTTGLKFVAGVEAQSAAARSIMLSTGDVTGVITI